MSVRPWAALSRRCPEFPARSLEPARSGRHLRCEPRYGLLEVTLHGEPGCVRGLAGGLGASDPEAEVGVDADHEHHHADARQDVPHAPALAILFLLFRTHGAVGQAGNLFVWLWRCTE